MSIRKILVLLVLLIMPSCDFYTDNQLIDENATQQTSDHYFEEATSTPTANPTIVWMNEEIEYGKDQVYTIVLALDEYFLDNSSYPETLDELVPNYLDILPLTIQEEEFDYRQNVLDEFIVSFTLSRKGGDENKVICGYIKARDLWECSGSGP